MALPIKTTMEDCDKIVAYLKGKPAGATVAEAKGVIDAKHLDGRKLKAYEAWGLITANDGRIALTDAGRELARDSSAAPAHYRGVIDRVRPYRSAIERAHHAGHDALLLADVAANWHDHQQDALGTKNETSIKDAVTCFFNLAEGAGLGKYILGRGGQETRLDLVRAEVSTFIDSGPSAPPWSVPAGIDEPDEVAAENDEGEAEVATAPEIATPATPPPPQPDALKVFITHGRNRDIVEQVETMLGVTEIDYEVAIESESTAIPVPEKVLSAMRRCNAAIICVSVEDDRTDGEGNPTINENVLIEIGAAFVLYNQKVILLWDRRLKVPSNLQGLYRCEFEGDEIGFKEVMRLMKAVKEFRTAA
jgi:predicted nucleotide-binding protein